MATVTFSYNGTNGSDGSVQMYVVPSYCNSIAITAYGSNSIDGGYAGTAYGVLSVTPGATYYINVGGRGYHYNSGSNYYASGGYNGGGAGGSGEDEAAGSPGGGMTWLSPTNIFDSTVIIVAGGGAASDSISYGYGGGLSGGGGQGNGPTYGQPGAGGTQFAGGGGGQGYEQGSGLGYFNGSSGGFGQGGSGGFSGLIGDSGGGGGGGGYYGGGGGGGMHNGNGYGTGGGGSSYLSSLLTGSYTTQAVNNAVGQLVLVESVFNLTNLQAVDFEAEGELVITSGPIKAISVSDAEAEGELVSLARQHVQLDQSIQVGTSSYKWLTETLQNAQNQFAVQPYISCQIIDETLLVNQQIYNTSSGENYGFSGDSVIAPDGTILAIGQDNSGNLRFARITDGTQLSQWNQILQGTGGTVIATSGNWEWVNPNFNSGFYSGFHLNASIAVSEYISGAYVVDVYYWYNDGTYFDVKRARSVDGGNTFTPYNDINFTNTVNSSTSFMQVIAGKPVYIPATGKTSAAAFILIGSDSGTLNNQILYNYTADGTSYSGGLGWNGWGNFSPQYILQDWNLHSFDVEYINGTYYCVFAGYHSVLASTNMAPALTSLSTQGSFFGNYGLYMTKLMQPTDGNATATPPALFWAEPQEVLVFNSSSTTNMNQALYPSLSYDGQYLWLSYRLDNTTSVSESAQTTTSTNYYLSRSADFKNFDYPTEILDSSGNSVTTYPYNGLNKYSFIGNQNGYYYFWGDGALWQFIQNNIVADISNYVSSVQIQDQTGGASSINMVIANASGVWAGPSPTGIGYQAIWKNGQANRNSKVYLELGYITSLGTGETVPRNVFYVDDITQNVTSNNNTLTLVGRDWNKLLSVTQTAFTFNFNGPDFYNDPFSNTSVSNWNQVAGTWIQTTPQNNSLTTSFPGDIFVPYTTYVNTEGGTNAPKYQTSLTATTMAILSGYSITHPEITLSASVYIPLGLANLAQIDFYPWYLNSNNYLQVSVQANGGDNYFTLYCKQVTNGSTTTTGPGTSWLLTASDWFNMYIRVYNFGNDVDILLGQNSAGNYGNALTNFVYEPISVDPTYQGQAFNWQPSRGSPYNTYYDLPGQLATVAIGTSGDWGTDGSGNTFATIWTGFYNLKFTQETYSQTIGELTESLGTLAHIYDYLPEQDLVQDLYDSTQWNPSNSVSFPNRMLSLGSQSFVLQNNEQYTDGQIEFDAQLVVPTLSESFGFDFIFRSQSATSIANCYKVRVMNSSNNGSGYLVKVSMLSSFSGTGGGTDLPLYSSIIPDNLPQASYGGTNNLNIDLTQVNHYKIAFNKGWISVFINSIMVFSWYDNNLVETYTTGYWGFSTVNTGASYDYAYNANEVLLVWSIQSPTFWQQINAFSLNPGDDLTSAIQQNLQTVYGWNFSDLGGRMKIVVLKSSDPVSYYYGDGAPNYLLYDVSNDNSDKEYYNAVLIVGDGVSYLATDGSSVGTNGILREEVIVDYQITSVADAQTRAQQELLNIEKYIIQPAPSQNLNAGSEIFDVVNIQDQSTANSSDLDGNYRVYTQGINVDNQTNHSITLGTGNITSS